MQATNSQLIDFIGASKQYFIPIFQRDYSWDTDDCIKLLSDTICIAEDNSRPCHFIGSIIYLPNSQFASTITECAIIDGQQRLTTISLMLLALAHYSKEYYENESDYEKSDTKLEQIKEMYLINKFGKNHLKYKLRLNGEDFKAYKHLVDTGECLSDCEGNKVIENYKSLLSSMRSQKVDPAVVLKGIHKLLLVDIPLNREDNAQLVFETVNSTGKSLTETQKIKNYILMTVAPEEQEDLYNHYWAPMEKQLEADELESFFRYYLTVKTKSQISVSYYNDFKEYLSTTRIPTKDCILDAKQFFNLYIEWRKASADSSSPVDRLVFKIKATKQDKITPTILQIKYDVKFGKCSVDEAIDVLTAIESYFMRRKLCNFPTNTAGSVCNTMLKNLGKEKYYNGFIKILPLLTYAQRMPSDEELIRDLRTTQFYGKDHARYVLDVIEAHENKDYVHSAKHSIEHIMPQTIRSHEELYADESIPDEKKEKTDWAIDLGDNWEYVYKKYVNTLGNLTLTGFNSEYQNYRFKYKRDMEDGYSSSPIRITANTLPQKEKWGETEINERSDWLSNIIVDIWKYPVEK